MRKHIKHILVLSFIFSTVIMSAQNRETDTLNTGVIDIIKPYAPSISDAFKVKEIPKVNDEITASKKEVKYNIFSFPVASTFTPAKGKAATVETPKSPMLYDNYASLGFGNYTTILGEVFLDHTLSKTDRVGGFLTHHSSGGGIKDVVLDNSFSNSKAQLNYTSQQNDLAWNMKGGFQYQTYNWYGLAEPYVNNQTFVNSLDVRHAFYNVFFGADIDFEDTAFDSASFLYRRFGDDQGSGENRFIAKMNFDIPLEDEAISTDFKFDYLKGAFDRSYSTNNELNYGNFLIGLSPSYKIKQDDFNVNLGVSMVFLNNMEAGKSKLYLYPKIDATYKVVSDVVMAYGGVTGGLIQNSYYDFSKDNSFVSPTLFIVPTNQNFNIYLGLKGKLSSNMGYNFGGSYANESNKALFVNNVRSLDLNNAQHYEYGNSFGVVYDDVNTFKVSGEINADVNSSFKLTLKAEYFSYNTDGQSEAWNLPDIVSSLFLDYQIDEYWFTGANLFYVGKRKDLLSINNQISTPLDLKGFFDANAHFGYHVNERVSLYAKGNNLTNNKYKRWQNFQVQGIQFLVGATFKFDF